MYLILSKHIEIYIFTIYLKFVKIYMFLSNGFGIIKLVYLIFTKLHVCEKIYIYRMSSEIDPILYYLIYMVDFIFKFMG